MSHSDGPNNNHAVENEVRFNVCHASGIFFFPASKLAVAFKQLAHHSLSPCVHSAQRHRLEMMQRETGMLLGAKRYVPLRTDGPLYAYDSWFFVQRGRGEKIRTEGGCFFPCWMPPVMRVVKPCFPRAIGSLWLRHASCLAQYILGNIIVLYTCERVGWGFDLTVCE